MNKTINIAVNFSNNEQKAGDVDWNCLGASLMYYSPIPAESLFHSASLFSLWYFFCSSSILSTKATSLSCCAFSVGLEKSMEEIG